MAPHHHGSRDGVQPCRRVREGPRPAERADALAARARARLHRVRLPGRTGADTAARRGTGPAVRSLRRDTHPVGSGHGAPAQPAVDRQPDVLHAMDLDGHAGAQSPDHGRRQQAPSRRPARRAASRGRAPAAHRALARRTGRRRRRYKRRDTVMAVKIAAAIVAVILMGAYLLAPVYKLKEVDLGIAIILGLILMLIDLWQSLKSKDD